MKNVMVAVIATLLLVVGFQNCGKKESTVDSVDSSSSVTTMPPNTTRGQFTVLKEYKHKVSGKYFFTGRPADQAYVQGTNDFDLKGNIKLFSAQSSTAKAVWRFWIPGTGSHFYTPLQNEVDVLNSMPADYINEGIEAYAILPLGTKPSQSCPSGSVPVYRLWSGMLEPPTARTHRFTGSLSVRQNLISASWVDEGIGFCAVEANTIN